MNECATADCPEIAGTLYLCPHCIRDLKGRLEQGIALLPELNVTIAGLDNVRVENAEGCNGDRSAGSKAPLNIGALELQMSLQEDTSYSAEQYAADPWSAGEAARVIHDVIRAELLISGPEQETINHEENRARVEEIAPPMPMRELLPWLRTNARMAITSQAVRQWVSRGLLVPAVRGTPAAKGKRAVESTYRPHEVIDAWHKRNN